jgi:Bacteriophage KPP10, Structural protein ORF10
MALLNYNPKDVSIIIGTQIMKGFADGPFISVEYDEDAFNKKIGADGEGTRVKTNNFAGRYTLTLDQASESNDYLSGLAALDRASGAGVVPVTVRDVNGNTLYFSESGWVLRIPTMEFGKEAADREWVLDAADIQGFIGGHSS